MKFEARVPDPPPTEYNHRHNSISSPHYPYHLHPEVRTPPSQNPPPVSQSPHSNFRQVTPASVFNFRWQTSLQSADPPSAKYEPVDDLVLHPGIVKDDNDTLLAAKASPEPFPWHSSQDLMSAVFGGDSTVAVFDIRLNNDVYLNANKETAVNVFPNANPSLVTTSFPDETPEMYHWRGDYGLLDRLSYGESREIPRNWKMTSLDPARIQARMYSHTVYFTSHSPVSPTTATPTYILLFQILDRLCRREDSQILYFS